MVADTRESEQEPTGSSAVDRVLDVLEFFIADENDDAVSVTELSRATRISRPALYRVLTTLEERGWATRREHRWTAGAILTELGEPSARATSIVERVRPVLERLWEEFGETVNLGVPSRDEVLYIDIIESSRGLRTGSQVGSRDPLNATALGKIFLSSRTANEVRRYVTDRVLPRPTEHTIGTLTPLLRELELVKERGWALDDEESEAGVRCIAVPVNDAHGHTIAAVSLSGPVFRLDDETVVRIAATMGAHLHDLRV